MLFSSLYFMEYKNYAPASQYFLSDDDDDNYEHPQSIFFNLDDLEKKGTLNSTFDYLGVLQMYAVCTHFLAVIPTIQKFLNELKIQPKKKYFQPV